MEKGKQYQWVKTDKAGSVETVSSIIEDDGITWVNFENEGRINVDLINDYMIPIEGEFIDFTTESAVPVKQQTRQDSISRSTKKEISNPITEIFNRLKNNPTEHKLHVDIVLPTKTMYDIMLESFDKEEVDKALTSFIKNQLTQESLNKSILKLIESL